MRKIILATLVSLLTLPAFAQNLAKDAMLGKTPDEVKAKLVEMGYEVRKTAAEDGKIEAYAIKDSKTSEIYVDPATGLVTEIKMN